MVQRLSGREVSAMHFELSGVQRQFAGTRRIMIEKRYGHLTGDLEEGEHFFTIWAPAAGQRDVDHSASRGAGKNTRK